MQRERERERERESLPLYLHLTRPGYVHAPYRAAPGQRVHSRIGDRRPRRAELVQLGQLSGNRGHGGIRCVGGRDVQRDQVAQRR